MKVGRNEPCPCGSGKKYKKCCLNKKEQGAIDTRDAQELLQGMINLRNMLLGRKSHIKKYHHLRQIHSDILDSMIDYLKSGKYNLEQEVKKADTNNEKKNLEKEEPSETEYFHLDIDPDDDTEIMFFYGLSIYNNLEKVPSITSIYLEKNKFRNQEKLELLEAMNQAYTSIFKLVKTEMENAYVYLVDVLSGKEYKIVDEALSLSYNKIPDGYLYTRIITVGDISFGNCSLLLDKSPKMDELIQKWKKDGYTVLDVSLHFLKVFQEENRHQYFVNDVGNK